MTDAAVDATIADLTDALSPVDRLRSPWIRAAAWLAVVAVLAASLARFGDLQGLLYRLRSVPDMGIAVLGSTLATVLGAVAMFQLSLPDRSPRWALLPLPGLAVWVAGTGMGCARDWLIPEMHAASLFEAKDCFAFIVGLSVPLSVLTIAMVRRGFPLRPNLVAATAGLSVAAAAATLLNFFHPYDVGVTDVSVHLVAIGLVIGANRMLGGRLLTPTAPVRKRGL